MTQALDLKRVNGLGLSAIAVSVLLLAACGGGGTATTSSATSAKYSRAYASGRIAGFGSIVINGVHYEETNANVVDEDGATHNSADLKLGMMAEVQASEFGEANNVTTATAQNITFRSLMRGPVQSKAADALVIFGQIVKVTTTTVFDDSLVGGLAAITTGDVVRVYGTLDTVTGVYTATRIEPQSGAELFSLRGSVTAYDSVTKTLSIGSALIDVSAVSLPNGIKAGSLVRVKLQTSQINGKWVAVSVKSGLFSPQDNDHSEVEGTISDFASSSSFSVDGLPVDASKASFPDGTAGLVKGARVEVEGAVISGVLVATKVKLKTDKDEQDEGFDIEGAITALDTVKSTLVVHGVTVSFTETIALVGGTIADLKVGAKVEIRGALAPDGTTVIATQITFDH
jgi:hypothetical protein